VNIIRSATLALISFLAACGTEEPPLCPTGDCTLPAVAVVRWKLNHYPELLFESDTCKDLDVKTMLVDVVGIDDPTVFETKDIDCNQGQASFVGLPMGSYSILVTALDANGDPLVHAGVSSTIAVGFPGSQEMVDVSVPFESWINAYTGTLLFRLSWAGASCETAVPTVMNQTLSLTAGGTTITSVMTDVGQKLDGSDPKPCRPHGEPFAQFAEGLPSGPATLTVSGTETGGTIAFEHVFDTFIGAGKNNPTITFDVPAAPPTMP
jgi:hypothetical protein